MALIKCPECGNMISDKAIKCPKCGCPVGRPSIQPSNRYDYGEPEEDSSPAVSRKWLYAVIGVLAAALVGVGYALYSNNQHQIEQEREQFVNDSLAQVQRDSLEQVRKDSLEKVRQDSIARANMVKKFRIVDVGDEKTIGALVNGKLMKANVDCGGGGSNLLRLLDEHDYDGNGLNDCLISYNVGGNHDPIGYCVVYYDEARKEFVQTGGIDFGKNEYNWCYNDPIIEYQFNKWGFAFKSGIERRFYSFDGVKIQLYDRKRNIVAKVKKVFHHEGLFNDVYSGAEMTKRTNFDVEGDGIDETLVFDTNDSGYMMFGRLAHMTIVWNNGKKDEQLRTFYDKVEFLTSKTKGKYDVLLDDLFLYKWNGYQYVESNN